MDLDLPERFNMFKESDFDSNINLSIEIPILNCKNDKLFIESRDLFDRYCENNKDANILIPLKFMSKTIVEDIYDKDCIGCSYTNAFEYLDGQDIYFKIKKDIYDKLMLEKYTYRCLLVATESAYDLESKYAPKNLIFIHQDANDIEKIKSEFYFLLVRNDEVMTYEMFMTDYNSSLKRKDYISWDEYFMGIAQLSSMRSKDPKTQVGACIVKDNKILSIGYNGFPIKCSDNVFPWNNEPIDGEVKDLYVVHAELNAILNYKGGNLSNSTMYVLMFPCNECAKAIIQSGIKTVIYMKDYKQSEKAKAAKRMFDAAGIQYFKYTLSNRNISFNL